MILQIPTTAHLNRMYYELAKIGANSVGARSPWDYKIRSKEELVAMACDMARYDPRLFDILVDYFLNHWMEINPMYLRSFYKKMKTAEVVAVICEFIKKEFIEKEASYFIEYLVMGLKPVATQFFFHDLYTPGGYLARRAVEEGLYEYKKWGFLACEKPTVDHVGRRVSGTLDGIARKNILKRLIAESEYIVISEYLKAVNNSISRQQALIDLQKSDIVEQVGMGRGSRWKRVA